MIRKTIILGAFLGVRQGVASWPAKGVFPRSALRAYTPVCGHILFDTQPGGNSVEAHDAARRGYRAGIYDFGDQIASSRALR